MAGLGLTIFVIVALLIVAVMLIPVAIRARLPHSVLLALFGISLGLLLSSDWVRDIPGGVFIEELKSLGVGAEAIFYLLLPPLIFEAAVKINVRRLVDDIGPILLLSIAGTVLTILFIGLSLGSFTGYALVACLMIGAIASSTDPLPVQEVFEAVGVPKRVDLLAEGESLFSDSTALVAYVLLLAMLTGDAQLTVFSGVFSFVEVTIGGAILGYLFARAFCWMFVAVGESQIAKNTLSICLAYLCFYLVDDFLGYSGVIAVVTAALVVGSHGRAVYSPTNWQAFLDLTGQISFVSKSIVFILVGLVAPALISGFGVAEFKILGVLLMAAFAARAVSVWVLLPLLSMLKLADPVENPVKIVMFWGASRGAISLALALAILGSPDIDEPVARFIGTMVCAFVLLTLFVNSITMQPLLRALGLEKLGKLDLAIKDRALFDALTELSDEVASQYHASNKHDELLKQAVADFDKRSRALFNSMAKRSDFDDSEWIVIALTAVAQYERRIYLGYLEDRLVSPPVARMLLGMADDLVDDARLHGSAGYYRATRRNFRFNWQARLAIWLHLRLKMSFFLRQELSRRFEKLVTVVSVMEEIAEHADERVSMLVYRQLMDPVNTAVGFRLQYAMAELQGLHLAYPAYGKKLEENLHKLSVARLEQQKYSEMLDRAVISAEVHEELMEEVEGRIARFSRQPELDLGLSPAEMLAKVPLFAAVPDQRKKEISRLLKSRFVTPDEKIIARGEAGDAMYFIATGAAKVVLDDQVVYLGSGDFFGEMALVTEARRNADVISEEYCRLLVLRSRDFRALMSRDEDIRRAVHKIAQERAARNLGQPGPAQSQRNDPK